MSQYIIQHQTYYNVYSLHINVVTQQKVLSSFQEKHLAFLHAITGYFLITYYGSILVIVRYVRALSHQLPIFTCIQIDWKQIVRNLMFRLDALIS